MLEIREVELIDIPQLMDLYMNHLTKNPPKEIRDNVEWEEMVSWMIEDDDYYLLVGEYNGVIVSSIAMIVVRNLTYNFRPYSVIENVVTHSDYRKKRFASKLLSKAVEIASYRKCYKIMLMTGSKRESTLRFYEKNGFDCSEKTAFIKRL